MALCLVLPACALAEGMTPGTYEGSAEGRFGTIIVEVTVTEDKIENITVKEHHDSAGVSDLPLSRIPEDIVAYQSLGVDTVSGATLTSYGVINAVANALEQAGAVLLGAASCTAMVFVWSTLTHDNPAYILFSFLRQ